ncbi:MAG: PH domain-containing protein [Candidatus Hydrothermarchaeales archaeon]
MGKKGFFIGLFTTIEIVHASHTQTMIYALGGERASVGFSELIFSSGLIFLSLILIILGLILMGRFSKELPRPEAGLELEEGEKLVYAARPKKEAFILRAIMMPLLASAIVLSLFSMNNYAFLKSYLNHYTLGFTTPYVYMLLYLVTAVVFYIVVARAWRSSEFIASDKRIFLRTGILKKWSRKAKYDQVRDIVIKKSVLQSLLESGTLLFRGTSGVAWPNIPNPEEAKETILKIMGKGAGHE